MVQRTSALTSADDAARAAAAAAADLAANARQMVLNRDPRLEALETGAVSTTAAMKVGTDDRVDLRKLITDLAAAVAAIPKPMVPATGQGKTASLIAVGASADVVVTLSRAMPNVTYAVDLLPISTGLLAGAATITVKTRTKTDVTLTVTANVAVAAASVVSVIAWGQP